MGRVLVVDDEPDIRAFIGLSLKLAGYEVMEASNGLEALAEIERGAIDMVILDLRMPELDGWGVIEALRANGSPPTLPIVVISAHATGDTSKRCLELGCKEYLSKPFTPEQILDAVGRWTESEARRPR
jgi:CheY-like chemotaxis protein